MILTAIVGLSLVVTSAFDAGTGQPPDPATMSIAQKNAVLRPLVSSATDCIVRQVGSDPRFKEDVLRGGDLGELIVDSMPACAERMRALIDAYDRLFGSGSGEAFFMGPYLDLLPAAVTKQLKRQGE
jgi:hypothetical protein